MSRDAKGGKKRQGTGRKKVGVNGRWHLVMEIMRMREVEAI